MTELKKKEFVRRVSQSNKSELVVVIYELLLTYTEDAKDAYEKENKIEFCKCIKKMRGCVQELISSLNLTYALAQNMLRLYTYCIRELAAADARYSLEALMHVENVMTKLHEAYRAAVKEDNSEPLMQNAQTVYAGLTYGKENLVENLGNEDVNRGFFA